MTHPVLPLGSGSASILRHPRVLCVGGLDSVGMNEPWPIADLRRSTKADFFAREGDEVVAWSYWNGAIAAATQGGG